ncbi:hypothetical protein ACA910_019367 [Epithemia clementina (nom. ined.)]
MFVLPLVLSTPWSAMAFQSVPFAGVVFHGHNGIRTESSESYATKSSSSRKHLLRYRNGDVDEYLQQRLGAVDESSSFGTNSYSNTNSRWWKGLFPGQHFYGTISPTSLDASSEETSQRVDEYLKFLEKRYNQIRESERQSASQSKPMAAFLPRPLLSQDSEDVLPPPAKSIVPAPEPEQQLVVVEKDGRTALSVTRSRSFWAAIFIFMLRQRNVLNSTNVAAAQQKMATMISTQGPAVRQMLADVSVQSVASLAWKRVPEIPMHLLRLSGGWQSIAFIIGALSALSSGLQTVLLRKSQ